MKLLSAGLAILGILYGIDGSVLDSSCINAGYEDMIIEGMKEAFDLADAALEALEKPSSNENIGGAQQDLQSFLFPTISSNENDKDKVIDVFQALRWYNTYLGRPQPYPTNPKDYKNLKSGSVIIYCDYSRFVEGHTCDGKKDKTRVCDTYIGQSFKKTSNYINCKGESFMSSHSTQATTTRWPVTTNMNLPSSIQLCAAYLKKQKENPTPNLEEQGKSEARKPNVFSKFITGKTEMDIKLTFGTTLLHEMTHAIPKGATKDVKGNDSYGWKNCVKLSNENDGIDNADTYALFALASRMINPGESSQLIPQVPTKGGSVEIISGVSAAKRDVSEHEKAMFIERRAANLQDSTAGSNVLSTFRSIPRLQKSSGVAVLSPSSSLIMQTSSITKTTISKDASSHVSPSSTVTSTGQSTTIAGHTPRESYASSSTGSTSSISHATLSIAQSSDFNPSSVVTSTDKSTVIGEYTSSGEKSSNSSSTSSTSSITDTTIFKTSSSHINPSPTIIPSNQSNEIGKYTMGTNTLGTTSGGVTSSFTSLSSTTMATITQSWTTDVVPITVINVSKSGTTSPVTYVSTYTSSGSIKPTGAWMCTGPLCDTGSSCLVPLFCSSFAGSSSSWGLCCDWEPPIVDGDSAPTAGGPSPGPPSDQDDDNKSSDSQHRTTASQSSASQSSASQTASTSSCSTQTISGCSTSYTVVTPTGASTGTISTVIYSCSTTTGCPVSPATTLTGTLLLGTVIGDQFNALDTSVTNWYALQDEIISVALADTTDAYVTWYPSTTPSYPSSSAIRTLSPSATTTTITPTSTPTSTHTVFSSLQSSSSSGSIINSYNTTGSLMSHTTLINTACLVTSSHYTSTSGASAIMETYCECGEVQAGYATTTMSRAVVAGCQMNWPSWPLLTTISTIKPTTSSTTAPSTTSKAAYHTGTCDVHIFEASRSASSSVYVQLNITDGAGDLLASKYFTISWGGNVTVTSEESTLPYSVEVNFLKQAIEKRMVGPDPSPTDAWEAWPVTIGAGFTDWDSTDTNSSDLPYCSVGDWDNGGLWTWLASIFGIEDGEQMPNRQMDCYWKC